MLGVLAVIGVLSVGAIAGYSKAMLKYKLNKQTEQIGSIFDYITVHNDMLLRDTKNIHTSVNDWTVLKALGAIPKEMIRSNTNYYIDDVFGVPMDFMAGEEDTRSFFRIVYRMDDGISSDHFAPCVNLYQMAALRHAHFWQIVLTFSEDDDTTNFYSRIYGDDYCSGSNLCLKDLQLTDIESVCSQCAKQRKCHIAFLWGVQYL